MSRPANARLAGFAFLFYIAIGITQTVLGRATAADGTAARLALMDKRFGFSEIQANHILDMPLGRLTKLGREELDKERKERASRAPQAGAGAGGARRAY